jgi:capsular polysaccharide biosynthesis protein
MAGLYFSPLAARNTNASPAAVRWLRTQLLAGCQVTATTGTRRVYVSRRLAAHRRPTNEPEIDAMLQNNGLETDVLEQLSFREQVAPFAQADIVVGPQGSGLTNMLFAPAGAILVDIQDPTRVKPFFWSLAEVLEQEYRYVLGETVPNPGGLVPDIFLPVHKLQSTLDQILDHRKP